VVIQRHYKIHALLFFIVTLVYSRVFIKLQIIQKSQKLFIINLGSKTKWSFFYFIFLNQILNQLNHISSLFSLKLKNTNKLTCHLAFHFKTIFKTNKKHKTNQTSISTSNYEVLISHGYVGKGPSPSKSIKNVDE